MALRFAHTNVRVADSRAAVAFYRHLGLEVTGCLTVQPGYHLLYMSAPKQPDVTLELVVNTIAGPDYERSPGTGHIALAVGDLDTLLEGLDTAGIRPESAPFHPGDRPDLRVCFVQDPDGTRVELIEGSFPTPSDPVPDGLLP
ncbi:VOC family protein [Streptomyces sp. NPDC091217]|uniref:VOC family protein n=1 Tax=Streptomyces sp. NPDC091217 TaxID=3365975 RepID=UPI0038192783